MGEKQEKETKTAPAETEFTKLLGKPFTPMGGSDEPFSTPDQFVHVQRVAMLYAQSERVPAAFRGKVADCAIIVALAWRHKADPIPFFEHMHVINGKPGMDAQLSISIANNSGRFAGPIQHEIEYDTTGRVISCAAYVVLKDTGEVITGSPVTWAIVDGEGWSTKSGSKWKTMPAHMFRLRSSVFMLREYFPELLMGMYSTDELNDISEPVVLPKNDSLAAKIEARKIATVNGAKPPKQESEPKPEPLGVTELGPETNNTDGPTDEPTPPEAPAEPPQEPAPTDPDANPFGDDEAQETLLPPAKTTLRSTATTSAKSSASKQTERQKLVGQYGDLCQQLEIKPRAVTQMSNEALQGKIADLTKRLRGE